MAVAQKINCKKREKRNSGYLNELRRKQSVPGIIYGKGQENLAVLLDNRELTRIFTRIGSRGIFSLQVEGEKAPLMALVREIQKEPLSGDIIHVDFLTIKMDEKINSKIMVYFPGEEEVVKKGGILQVVSNEVEISCLPIDLPEHLIYDVSNLELGEKVSVKDLIIPENVEVLEDPEAVLASILAPRGEEEVEAEEESAEAAPGESGEPEEPGEE